MKAMMWGYNPGWGGWLMMSLGFAAGRNRNSEEERSHSGLQEWEKKVFLRKNLFRNRES